MTKQTEKVNKDVVEEKPKKSLSQIVFGKASKRTKLPYKTEIQALIYTSNEKQPDVVTIKKYHDDFFYHKNKAYKIDFENVIFFKRKKLFWGGILYLFYHYDNDQPLQLNEEMRSLATKRIPNSVLYTALKSDAIRKANDIKSGGFIDDNLMYIVIGATIIGVLYFMFGG